VKVKDVIAALSLVDPESSIVLKSIDTRVSVPPTMKKIRVYNWKNRVVIDGFEPETV
jgi:hypothetical protein